ncbi:hypothetical protein MNAN1_003548 [Malassezia nana]|uniref:Pinin/SDK/MemA protein domain-containing protein n=1 Tax=Malassezia nana TaxID=180528 RepID=A0AAF0J3U4_9BASI|nr:hypothetical protein MNAN1_003548 [Malassezia nana]
MERASAEEPRAAPDPNDPPSEGTADRAPSARAAPASVDRQRHRRMLGVLHSTLAQARAGPARAAARPTEPAEPCTPQPINPPVDVAEERRAHDAERAMVRRDVQRVHELAEKLAAHEAAHRAARASKRRLSSFLVTHTASCAAPRAPRDPAETAATQAARIVPSVPLGAAGQDDYEIYYLPRTLLPAQEDELDEQEELVDAEMERADDEWDRLRDALQTELREIQERLARHHVQW